MLRLIWGFLLPLFPLLGYPPEVIAQAGLMMYLLYAAVDAILLSVARPICAPSERRLLRESALYLPWLPLYRTAIYFFRLSGILKLLSEGPRWCTPAGILDRIRIPGARRVGGWLAGFLMVWAE
jgi:hypothetical protein